MANLGAEQYLEGRLREAIEWTERAWKAGNVMAGFNLGRYYFDAGDTHRADVVWQQAAALGDVDAMMCVARLALRRGDHAAADVWLEPLLAQKQPYPITALGVAYQDNGHETTALRIFERAIALGDGYAMEYAARIHQARGDIATATQLRRDAKGATRYGCGLVTDGRD